MLVAVVFLLAVFLVSCFFLFRPAQGPDLHRTPRDKTSVPSNPR